MVGNCTAGKGISKVASFVGKILNRGQTLDLQMKITC